MKVSAIIRKDQPDKNGQCKIAIRINTGNKKSLSSTEFKVRPAQFKKGKVVNHEDAVYINSELNKLIAEFTDMGARSKVVTFHSYCLAFIHQHEKTGTRGKATIRYYSGELAKFLKFTDDQPLHKITPDLIKAYHVHMKAKGNSHNTIWKAFKFLKTIFNDAKKQGIVRSSPFEKLQPLTYKQTTRAFLTSEEVRKIAEVEIDQSNPLYNIQKWFLLQCYTGLRSGDLKQLDKAKILNEGRIIIEVEKTGTTVSIPLSDEVKQLLNEVPPFSITNQNYNLQLKALAATAKINKTLTSHMARHSHAMRLAELGISKEVASKVLGHKKSATTDIYYKIQDERVNAEMSKFKF